ncbi:hypothetical protein LCGC14_0355600 [marine sediment metagenome]|uniref:Uncharacterized protein n=1 Tax=marine sediment metagenome TaxID=412755 RepID=A0A0F9WHG6_9ZZZZ
MLEGNTSEYEGTLKELDVPAIENEELVGSVEARLANLRDITDGTRKSEPAEPAEPTPKEPEEPGEPVEPGEPTEPKESAESAEPTPANKTGDKDGDKEDDVELSDAFLRAAIHRGWKEEDAQKYFETDPEAANSLFQNLLIDVNKTSSEWAAIGKAKLEAEHRAAEVPAVPVVPVEKPGFKGVDVDRMIKDYDLDDNTAAILRAQNESIEALADLVQPEKAIPVVPVAPIVPAAPAGPDPNVELEIENFFSSDRLKPFNEFYGTLKLGQNWDDLSSGQQANRWKVLEYADYIIAGSGMDAVTAMDKAHLTTSEPIREQAIRDSIKATATKRKKSMTIRPSDSKRSGNQISDVGGGDQKPRTREELIESVDEKLAKVFG